MFRAILENDIRIHRAFFEGSVPSTVTDITATVYDQDGTELAPVSVNEDERFGTGVYQFVLKADEHTNRLQRLRIEWVGEINGLQIKQDQFIEVVASRYFSLGDLRAMDGIGDHNVHDDLFLEVSRAETEATFEDYLKISYTRRANTDKFDSWDYRRDFAFYSGGFANGGQYNYNYLSSPAGHGLFLRERPVHELVRVEIEGEEVADLSRWSVNEYGRVLTRDSFGGSLLGNDFIVDYIHGYEELPRDLHRAALRYARHLVLNNTATIPDRSRLMQTEFGLFVLDHPGDDKATGLPEVDGPLNRHREVSAGAFA